MDKAKQRALEKYPLIADDDKEGLEALKYIGMECECASVFNEVQEVKQTYFIEGYHQAEKDLELTWKDVSKIRQIMFDYNAILIAKMCIPNDEDYCKEILRRYKENIY